MKINDGGAAFPVPMDSNRSGMSLRDYFACQALNIIPTIAKEIYENIETWTPKHFAIEAYIIADEMIEARKRE